MNKNVMDTSDLMNLSDAAILANVSRQTFYTWIQQGKIQPVKISGGRLFNKSDVLKLKLERELNG